MAKRKAPTKKDLEAKIAELEAKLATISSQAGGTAETKKAPPPPPKPAEAKKAEAPKPAEQKAAPPATVAEALENAWQSYPAGNSTHWYKEHTTGFTPSTNRYYGRQIAPVGKVPTQDWNLQKAKVTGYTQPSNQYFATRQRLAYHPHDKSFTGYGLVVEGAQAQAQQAPPPPPPPPQPEPQPQAEPQQTASAGGSGKKSDLEAYEADYLARLEQQQRENAELMQAAEELAAKRRAESGGSSGQAGSSKGTLPKGF